MGCTRKLGMQRDTGGDTRAGARRPNAACSVGVLVDLELAENAGGHVKCWQRIAEAALHFPDQVDLTVYFLGEREQVIALGGNVRYVTLTPRLGTRRLRFLAQGAGHTDLAPYHGRLTPHLARHDVLHTTDIFAFGQTARQIAQRRGIPLVTSIHTDLPLFTKIYTAEILRRTLGDGVLARFVLNDLQAGARNARSMQRKVDNMIGRSDRVIVSNLTDWRRASQIVGAQHVSHLRRGIDLDRFHPAHRDRRRLAAAFGIPEGCPTLLFVGRIDATKKAMFAAETARSLIGSGHDLRFLAIGDGAQRPAIATLLGPNAVLPGPVPQQDLGWIYPSADIFVFPSESDITGNVVLEAKAGGLPVLVADHPGTAPLIRRPGDDGFILSTADSAPWHRILDTLLREPAFRRRTGKAARQAVENNWPSWRDVVAQDLLPVWRTAAPRADAPTVPAQGMENATAAP